MILVGDKLRDEQHALLYSSAIPCQAGSGNLTFTYVSWKSRVVKLRSGIDHSQAKRKIKLGKSGVYEHLPTSL